jgi:uncharacterized protein YqhQ
MNFCKYKNTFGLPSQGVHSYRIFNIAIVDVISTIIGAYIISKIFHYSFTHCLIFLFILGIILHYIFCVETTINTYIGKIFSYNSTLIKKITSSTNMVLGKRGDT